MPILFEANSAQDLRLNLEKLDTLVPPRGAQRDKKQTERFSIAYLLSSIPEEYLQFPLVLEQSERPDFVLRMSSSSIGIEVTEAIPENLAHETVLRNRESNNSIHWVKRALPNEERKTKKTILSEINFNSPGEPWIGDEPEEEWAEVMLHYSILKATTAKKSGFTLHQNNWLLIYDNWPLPHICHAKANSYLTMRLNNSFVISTFDRIFILDSMYVYEASETPNIYPVQKLDCKIILK